MNPFRVSSDIIPLSEFKGSIAKWMKRVQSQRNTLVITQNGKPAGVMISPEEYDELVYRSRFLASVSRGIVDADEGRVLTREELESDLASRRAERSGK